MLKYIGIALFSCSIFIFGLFKASELSYALNLRKSVLKLLYTIENDVLYVGKPKNAILLQYCDGILDKNGFTQALANGDVCGAVNSCLSQLEEIDRRQLISFFNDFGKSDSREREAEECKRFLKEFESAGKEFEKKQLSKIFLYKRLGIIFALAATVIFI